MEYPEVAKLYKYRSVNEYSLAALKNYEVWIATPESFNDPFDCQLEPGKLKNSHELQDQIFQIIDEAYSPEEAEKQKREISEENKDKPIQYFEDDILNKHLEEASEMGILSLSEKRDHILMWSHYADHHKGFCIEFHREDSEYNVLKHFMCRPVEYREDYPNLHQVLDHLDINLYTKAKDWEYEAEWRLVLKDGGKLFPCPGPITGIIFGLRMSESDRKKVISSLPHLEGIIFYQAKKRPGAFALDIEKIEI